MGTVVWAGSGWFGTGGGSFLPGLFLGSQGGAGSGGAGQVNASLSSGAGPTAGTAPYAEIDTSGWLSAAATGQNALVGEEVGSQSSGDPDLPPGNSAKGGTGGTGQTDGGGSLSDAPTGFSGSFGFGSGFGGVPSGNAFSPRLFVATNDSTPTGGDQQNGGGTGGTGDTGGAGGTGGTGGTGGDQGSGPGMGGPIPGDPLGPPKDDSPLYTPIIETSNSEDPPPTDVPEPSTLLLMGAGIGFAWLRRRRATTG